MANQKAVLVLMAQPLSQSKELVQVTLSQSKVWFGSQSLAPFQSTTVQPIKNLYLVLRDWPLSKLKG